MQATQKGMDWGEVGKNAAINFGTAGLQMGAANAAKAAQAAQAARASTMTGMAANAGQGLKFSQAANGLNAFNVGGQALAPGLNTGKSAVAAFDLARSAGAASNAMNAAQRAQEAADAFDSAKFASSDQGMRAGFDATQAADAASIPQSQSALSSFKEASLPTVQASTPAPAMSVGASSAKASTLPLSTRIADSAYNAATKTGPTGTSPISEFGNQALTATLAPQGAQPLSGSFEGAGVGGAGGYQSGGDVLGAFGDPQMFTPNASGKRIDAAALERMTQSLGNNAYLQQRDVQDKFIPTGQTEPLPNTPYNTNFNQVNQNQDRAYQDLLSQVDNWNWYHGIKDANPDFTDETMQQYIEQPDLRPMAQVGGNPMDIFNGLKMPNLYNTSFIR
jgi:hypothetical protein